MNHFVMKGGQLTDIAIDNNLRNAFACFERVIFAVNHKLIIMSL